MNIAYCAHFQVFGFTGKLATSSGGNEGCINACRKLRQVQETKMHYLFSTNTCQFQLRIFLSQDTKYNLVLLVLVKLKHIQPLRKYPL